MKLSTHTNFDIVLYFVAFMLIQIMVPIIANSIDPQWTIHSKTLMAVYSASSLLTILVFVLARWTPIRRDYLRSHPWSVLLWSAILALGTILPSEFLAELIGEEMPEEMSRVFVQLMQTPWGYLVIGILAPVAEEVVFRGAILRALLKAIPQANRHWIAIGTSALLFALVHGNLAQAPHAFLMGLLLGWMYYRTGSIFPGLVLHWVNNSVAYAVFRLMPGLEDASLIDLLQGDRTKELLYVGFSFLIILPSLYQLHLNMKKTNDNIAHEDL